MSNQQNMITSRAEVKSPTREQFIQLLQAHCKTEQSIVNPTFSEDGKRMTFDQPQQIKLTLTRKGSISTRQLEHYSGADISDYYASRDIDQPFVLEFKWGKDEIKLEGGTAYDLLHRFAKALAAITEYQKEE